MTSNFSQLAILGLATLSGQVFATVSVSGELRLDKKFPELPADTDDSLEFDRVRFEVAGDVVANWTAHVRLEAKDAVSTPGTAIAAERAYAQWTPLDNLTVLVGKAGHLDVDADSYYYAPHSLTTPESRGVLPVFGFQNDYGLSVHGSLGAFGYKLGLGKGTPRDVTAEAQPVPFSFAGRATFTAMNSDKMSWGLGLGFLNRKDGLRELITKAAYDHDNDANTDDILGDAHLLFPTMEGFTADLSGVVGKFALTAAVYTLKDKVSSVTGDAALSGGTYASAADPAILANNPYNKDGKADSFYVEAAYLVMGEGYRFADGVIHGPKFSSSALELGARVSQSTHKNASAFFHPPIVMTIGGLVALAADNTPAAFAAGAEYKIKTDAYSLFANYHVNSNAVVKVEFFNSKAKTTQSVNATFTLADVKARHLNVRAQFSF